MDVSQMNQEQLDEVKEAIMLRERELRIEKSAGIIDKMKIGIKVRYAEVEWKVVALDEEFCTLTPMDGEGRKKKVFYSDIEEIIKEKK